MKKEISRKYLTEKIDLVTLNELLEIFTFAGCGIKNTRIIFPTPKPLTLTKRTKRDLSDFEKNPPPILSVVGGIDSEKNAWPWLAALLRPSNSGSGQYCGASLISETHVLTAAHCVAP